jgi:S-formylglutathione hydrolase
MNIDVQRIELTSRSRDGIVETAVLLPPDFVEGDQYPLIIVLHGGSSSREQLIDQAEDYDGYFRDGVLPPAIVTCFSAGEVSWFLGWEQFVLEELPALLQNHYNVTIDLDRLALTGISMGGSATLTIGLSNPSHFRCIAVMEPAIEPSVELSPRGTRASWWRSQEELEALWGSPVNVDKWLADNPATIAQTNAEKIRASGLEIYVEAGDRDCMTLHDGAEFLHRILWDNDIRHEYHLVRWADHVGLSLKARYREVHDFIGASLTLRRVEPNDLPLTEEEEALFEWFATGGLQEGRPQPSQSPTAPERAPTVLKHMFAPLRESCGDPDMDRAYARLKSSV